MPYREQSPPRVDPSTNAARPATEGATMKIQQRRMAMTIIGTLCGIITLASSRPSEAGSSDYRQLAAEWWKWAYSVPCTAALCPNPVIDTTGDFAAVGQHGDVWFLAGAFGGTVTRHASVPEGSPLFFPVV